MNENGFYIGLKGSGNKCAPMALFITKTREAAIEKMQEFLKVEKERFSKSYIYTGKDSMWDSNWDMWYDPDSDDMFCIEDGVELYESAH